MKIRTATFTRSSERFDQLPRDGRPEFAFIGRSNVGKSSLINLLTENAGLAKVSGTPGKTRLVNHFLVDDRWYLVDLPGYGYARVARSLRSRFSRLATEYVTRSEALHYLFVLVDSRLEPQRLDLEFIRMLGREGIPFGIVFTKCDKLSRTERERHVERYRRCLQEEWEELPRLFFTSATRGEGRQELLDFIGTCLTDCS